MVKHAPLTETIMYCKLTTQMSPNTNISTGYSQIHCNYPDWYSG